MTQSTRPGSPAPAASQGQKERRTARFLPGVPLGKIGGIQLIADWSILLIVALITMNLGAGLLLFWHPDWSPALRWGAAFGAALLFFASILLHELSHALVGRLFGVRVPRITLFLFGGLAHMEDEPPRPAAEFFIAVVGPLTSIAIGILSLAVGVGLGRAEAGALVAVDPVAAIRQFGPAATLLSWIGPVNLLLGVFNLLPGFPLDGGRVLRAVLWWTTRDFRRATRWASGAGQGFGWAFITLGIMMAFGLHVPILGGGLFQGLWLVMIGWFLDSAARGAYAQVLVQQAARDLPVSRIMDTHIDRVSPDVTVADFVHERLLQSDQRCFAVEDGAGLQGLVCLEDVRRVPEKEWNVTPVSRIMTPTVRLTALAPTDQATRALSLLADQDVDQIPVVERGTLQGIVRRRDIVRLVGGAQADEHWPKAA